MKRIKLMIMGLMFMLATGVSFAKGPVAQLQGWQDAEWCAQQGDFKEFLGKKGDFPVFSQDVLEIQDQRTIESLIKQEESNTSGNTWVFSYKGKFGKALLKLKGELEAKLEPASELQAAIKTWWTKGFEHWGDKAYGMTTDFRHVHVVKKDGEWSDSTAGQANQWVAQFKELIAETPYEEVVRVVDYINWLLRTAGNEPETKQNPEFMNTLEKIKTELLEAADLKPHSKEYEPVKPKKAGWFSWLRRG